MIRGNFDNTTINSTLNFEMTLKKKLFFSLKSDTYKEREYNVPWCIES